MARRRNPMRLFLGGTLAAAGVVTWYLWQERAWHPAAAWLTALNLLTLALWCYDKMAARRGRARVPELALHVVALLGAVPASFVAMQLLRHKTLQPRFRRLYWAFLALQVALVALWLEPGLRPW